jgi:5-methylcytosine-specific restriction endonuclease McrA
MLKSTSDESLVRSLEEMVRSERKITAQILEHIREFDRRRLYLKFGHTSLFSYLTKSLGYTPAAAQRRIESARLLNAMPDLAAKVAEGSLNLSQLSLVAQSSRQLPKMNPSQRAGLLEKLKHQDFGTTQVLVAQELGIAPKKFEKKRFQRDHSVRLEITLDQSQQEVIQRARELLSHVCHNPNWAELITLLAKDSIRLRDPLAKTSRKPRPAARRGGATEAVAPERQNHLTTAAKTAHLKSKAARHIPAQAKRHILERDQGCQWKNRNGQKCDSRFQLQFDHIVPVRQGGTGAMNNLQLLCAVHNRLKGDALTD